ncbi:MAG TPA: multicopper oxidase domain-containing protein [Ktedonobacterales bacterium]|nr:multicopper oxidase domain-containing protein [Ktedonobacterales bacterium]
MKTDDIASSRISRRRLLQYGAAASAALSLPWVTQPLVASAAMGGKLAKYVQPLPLPGNGLVVATPSGANQYAFTQREIMRQLHPQLPPTPLWAYDDGSGLAGQAGSFGLALVAQKGTPVGVTYTNDLPFTYPAWIPVDTRLTPLGNQVRVMTHLHEGFVAADSDGNPAVTPNGFGLGDTQTVAYPNEQAAALMWFHDHGLGTTRLNVFAGLAAAYILRDQFDTGTEPNPIGIPGGAYEIPLVIQDRQFNPDGTFLYPRSAIPGVTWIGEYFGDVMLVNGKVWPFLNVEPRLYRFRILNGCNARILNLDMSGAKMVQIGAEGGLFAQPAPMSRLVLAPAERADVLVDFRAFAGQTLLLKNSAPQKPVVTPAPALAQVMQLRVGVIVTQPGPSAVPATLAGGQDANLPAPVRTRFFTLNEVAPGTANWFLNIDAAHFDPNSTDISIPVGDVEDWVYVNLTPDTHPMHVHLVTFQVIGRTPFNVAAYQAAFGGQDGVPGGHDPTPFATGPMVPPAPEERGFKDTVKTNPGYFTTIRAKFDLPSTATGPVQKFVHHCHIVEHEDNDMMQTFTVLA